MSSIRDLLEKLADKNNPGKVTKRLDKKPDMTGFAPKAYVKGTAKKSYLVGVQDGKSWRCTCPDFTHRRSKLGETCKHINLVKSQETRSKARGRRKKVQAPRAG